MPRRRKGGYRRRRGGRRITYAGTSRGAQMRYNPLRKAGRFLRQYGGVQRIPGGTTHALYNIGLPRGIAPKTLTVPMRYNCEVSLNPSSTILSAFVFKSNSIYDPEHSGLGGHSCYLFDTYASIYNKWRVLSSRIKVWYINPSVSDQFQAYVTVVRSPDGQMFQSFNSPMHLLESNTHGAVKVVGSYTVANQLSQGQAVTVGQTYSQRRFYPGVFDLNFEGTYNSNPSRLAFFELIAAPVAGNDPNTMYFRVQIDYLVKWSEQIILPQSGVNGEGVTNEGPNTLAIGAGDLAPKTMGTWSGGSTGPTGMWAL